MPNSDEKPIKKLTISIERGRKKFAVFDGFDVIKKFTKYENEEEALAEARKFCAEITTEEPEVVYPKITKIWMW